MLLGSLSPQYLTISSPAPYRRKFSALSMMICSNCARYSSQGTPFGFEYDGENDKSNKIRPLIAQAMNSEMLLCKFTSFLKDYGPLSGLIESADLERCLKSLLDANLLCKTDNGLQWTAYRQCPSKMSENEITVFEPLKKIVDKICEYAGSRRGNDYDYKLVPYAYLPSDTAGLNRKMDACIMEKRTTINQQTGDAVIPEEFKKYRTVSNQIEVSVPMNPFFERSSTSSLRCASKLSGTVSIS